MTISCHPSHADHTAARRNKHDHKLRTLCVRYDSLDVMGNRRPGQKKTFARRKNFFSSSLFFLPRTPRATRKPSIHDNPASSNSPNHQQPDTKQQQHDNNHGPPPLPQVARAVQPVHLPRRVHFEEPVRADRARGPLGKVSSTPVFSS